MRPIGRFLVRAALPAPLTRLCELAPDLQWTWNPNTIALFRRVDADLWERVNHNPVLLLDMVPQSRLAVLAGDDGFLGHLEMAVRELEAYHTGPTWYQRAHPADGQPRVAYFSAEFGITECLPIYSGGLGVLAGDHLKAASDLGVPLVGVGLLYQQGYFHQYLDEAGWQREHYQEQDFTTLPLTLERRDGEPVRVTVPHPGGPVHLQVWRAQVGRVPLYLLDTNIGENSPADRDITDQLYGGDDEMRIRQEIVLGIGGVRALAALGLNPPVCHMNEGHSAFAGLERGRMLMRAHGLTFQAAMEATAAGTVFTTHTPVPAGHDRFAPDLLARYLGDYAAELGLSQDELLALGRPEHAGAEEPFNMTTLALRLAGVTNGVSRLHGQVSRRMWQRLWPDVPEEDIPIGHITNGVHLPSWVSHDMVQLYDRYLGPRWREQRDNQEVWSRADRIPADELWRTHERRRERMVGFVRRHVRQQLAQRGAPDAELRAADEVLDPDALTIGFARRFATYKRALLLFRDPDRLGRLLDDPQRPVQIIIAGKAHPRDDAGKELIRRIFEFTKLEPFSRHVVFIEDYETATARYLVQGCDVWLNTPRPPMEASGTSGMKAAANGVLNLSTLDGWWAEAWAALGGRRGVGGWTIGRGETGMDPEEQDRAEAAALYTLLEREVIPTFYDRGPDRLPRNWVESMRQSLARLCPVYNMARVVQEYCENYYVPGTERAARLLAGDGQQAHSLAEWRRRVRHEWSSVRILGVDAGPPAELVAGAEFDLTAHVDLGTLEPADVAVQLCMGRLDAHGAITWTDIVTMEPGAAMDGARSFTARGARCGGSGMHGYTVRVLPRHEEIGVVFMPGLIAWAPEHGESAAAAAGGMAGAAPGATADGPGDGMPADGAEGGGTAGDDGQASRSESSAQRA
jgi:glycogen phosphorylase